MTLEKAIGILQYNGAPERGPTISAFIEARNLGIEAMKLLLCNRTSEYIVLPELLPGETED